METEAFYVPQRSDPEQDQYFFAYRITIRNDGDRGAKLLSRHWVITDGNGEVHEVRGPGVVGEQPHLLPGANFTYTSACPLPTQVGTMQGSYHMARDDGGHFNARIAPFTLAVPTALN